MRNTFHTPALRSFAAGHPVQPIGYVGGRPVYPIAGGAEDAVPGSEQQGLPTGEELQGMSAEDLASLESQIDSEAQDLTAIDVSDLTDEQLTRMEELAAFADVLDSEAARREQVSAERAERAEAARQRLAAPTDGGDGEDEGEEESGEDGAEEAPEPAEVETPSPEAVAAGASRPAAPRRGRPAPRRNPRPAEAGGGSAFALIAAADLGGQFRAGETLQDMSQVAAAFAQKSKSFPQGPARMKNIRHQHNVAMIERRQFSGDDGLHVGNKDFATPQALFQAAAQESRLAGGSLIKARSVAAAGGWCAPSETIYGLTNDATQDGLIDLPTVGVNRGGINYTPGPDFSDIFTSAGFSQTEAQAIAGTEKPCVEIDCPDFQEVRLDAVGYCVKAPLLTRAAYPEAIQNWIEGTMVANAHKVAARLISSMRTALGTPLAPTLTGTPITWGTLSIIEWVIEMQRQAYRLSDNETLEVVIPRWVRVAIRADLANRAAVAERSITNAQINQHFADRGAAVQWVLNYLEVGTPKTSVAFPSTFEVMVYPAGTFVKGTADVVNLDTVYDTADLQTNVYTAAFVEDGVLLAKMKHGGARITIPVFVTGMMGSLQLDDNLFGAQAENAGAAA